MALLVINVNELYSPLHCRTKSSRIFEQIPNNGDDNNFLTERRNEYFQPQTNRRYEVYRFRQTKQNQEESLDQFHTRLRTLARNCEFADDNLDFEIEQQILVGGTSSRIRKRAIRDPKYTLKDMLVDGLRDEISTYQSREIESTGHSDACTNTPNTTSSKEG